jgi:flavodoxin
MQHWVRRGALVKALVAYDSAYGNTEQIAHAIGGTLGTQEDVTVLRVGEVKPDQLKDLGLLVVGSPTQGFRPTRETKGFLGRIPARGLAGVKVAAFDTRYQLTDASPRVLRVMIRWFGYAAKSIADRLVGKGGELVVPPAGFFVEGTEGPLKHGELERAAEWAGQLVATH